MAAAVLNTSIGRLGEIDLKQVSGDHLRALGPAAGGEEQARGGDRCQLRVSLNAHHRRAKLKRLRGNPAVAATELVKCVAWPHIGPLEGGPRCGGLGGHEADVHRKESGRR